MPGSFEMQFLDGYALSDFLLFSPRVYERLFELLNQDLWPAHVAFIALGLLVGGLAFRRHPLFIPCGLFLLGLAWALVTIVFFKGRYDAINWLGGYIAIFSGLQAVLLVMFALITWLRDRPVPPPSLLTRVAGLSLLILGLLGYPLVAPVFGRAFSEAQFAGGMPDPTAVATLGILLLSHSRGRWIGMVVPTAWCAFSGLTHWMLERPDFFIAPLAAGIALLALLSSWMSRARQSR